MPVDGGRRTEASALNLERVSTLVIVSRIISAFMGVGVVVAIFLTARVLFDDNVAAFFSGLAIASSMLFVFYSHLGNLDIPCTFWFAWIRSTQVVDLEQFVYHWLSSNRQPQCH